MISKINVSIILFSILCSLSLGVETDGTRLVRQLFAQKKFCMDQENYPQVDNDIHAAKLYVQKICSQVNPSTAASYISQNYGAKVKVMGQGSFGKVLKYKKNNNLFAIKIPSNFDYRDMFRELNGSECIKEMLADSPEISNMAYIFECVHPARKSPHLIMKFLPMTVREYVFLKYKNGWDSLNDTEKTKIVTQMYKMALTLKALHDKGIAHRDLKPENIMMTTKGNPVLVDFGLLTPMGDLAKSLAGTPFYIDYEVMNRNSGGLSSDVYSLLMTYVFMLHGKNAEIILNSVLKSGDYMQVRNGTKKLYTPNFAYTKLPRNFQWMNNMFIPSRSGRWKMAQVIQQFEQMLGISSGPKVDPKDQEIISQNPQHIPNKMVMKAPAMDQEIKQIVEERPVVKKEITKMIVERPLSKQEIQHIKVEEPSSKQEIFDIQKNRAEISKAPQFHMDQAQFKNKYLEMKKPVLEKQEIPLSGVSNNYYRYEKNFHRPEAFNGLDKKRQHDFQQKMSALDEMIAQLQKERMQKAGQMVQGRPKRNFKSKQVVRKYLL